MHKLAGRRILAGVLGLLWLVVPCPADESSDGKVIATSGTFAFRLSNGKELTGYTGEDAAAKIILAGNELNVPLSLVESIRFNSGNDGRVRVELSNGDSVSGQLVPGIFEVVADWGKAKINSSSLSQISRVKGEVSASRAVVAAPNEMVPAVRVDRRGTP